MGSGEYGQKLLIFCLYFLYKNIQHFSLYFEFKIKFNIILFLFRINYTYYTYYTNRILIMTNYILCFEDINLGQSKVKNKWMFVSGAGELSREKTTGVL